MFNYIKDALFFVLIFGFINDNLMVDMFGANILKIVFVLFMLVNIVDIIKATFLPSPNIVMKTYFVFISILSIITLYSVIFLNLLTIVDALTVLLSIHVVFVYVSYYKNLDKLLYFIWISVFVSAFSSLFHQPIAKYTFRITGGTADPVEFSVHLFMGLIIAIYLYNKNKNIIFLLSSFVLFLYAMLYAGSKTAILTMAFLIFYTTFIRFRYIFRQIFSLRGLFSFLIIGFLISQTSLGDKVGKALEGIKSRTATKSEALRTAKTRFASWEAGYGMIEDYFLTGVGVNQFSKHAEKYLRVDRSDAGLYNPHNIFVKIFSEAGVLSFLSFVLFLIVLLRTRYKELIQSEYFWITLIPIASILMGLALNITYKEHFWMSFALLSNVILFYQNNKYGQKDFE